MHRFYSGYKHPLGGYNSSSANVHIDISPINSEYKYENVSVILEVGEGIKSGWSSPRFEMDNPTIVLNAEGIASYVGVAETGGADLVLASTPEMNVQSIVEISGCISYYSVE